MKKILCLTLALILALSCLSGCVSTQPQATTAAAETAAEENITCTTETVLPFSNRLHGIFCFGFKKKSFFFRISY